MGLDINGIRLLLVAKRLGADFESVVTIGRQGLYVTNNKLKKEFSDFDIPYKENAAASDHGYSEKFFSLLGAQTTQSIDNSDYEAATIIHDMNNPLPEVLKGRFSVVVDAGTLEHVFNYPVAIKNCMELLREGGVFISITPANNFMGHGFYQFSPELFFSVFTHENGFDFVKLYISEIYDDSQWYEVGKPKGGNAGRVTLINHEPTHLMCIARRSDSACEPFKKTPQQTDYVEAWETADAPKKEIRFSKNCSFAYFNFLKNIIKYIPGSGNFVRGLRYFMKSNFPGRDYAPINPNHIKKKGWQ